MKILIVGKGVVGTALSQEVLAFGWQPRFYPGRCPDSAFAREAEGADAVAIAISTKDKGEIELGYIGICLDLGVPVVTCAKGALAWHYDALRPHLRKIGHSTTVGGASNLLALAESPRHCMMTRADMIANGTLNFLCWAAGEKIDPHRALAGAVRLGLCEPGATSLAAVVNGEIQDIIRKSSIFWNSLRIGQTISPDDFSYSVFTEDEISRSLGAGTHTRFVVTVTNEGRTPFSFEAIHLDVRPWTIVGSFMDCPEDSIMGFVKREWNCLAITMPWGVETITGIGAGARPTALAMLDDARMLLSAA